MKIGYASLTKGIYKTNFKTTRLKNANEKNLLKVIEHNLDILDRIIDYNIRMGIYMFRISSNIIPFGSSPVNKIIWEKIFKEKFEIISKKIKENKIRVSMHPGQYTVLNSPREEVVVKAIEDLEYHNRFLDALKMDMTNKIILHIGGVYGDKEDAIRRFEKNYKILSKGIKSRLIIENDDKSYNIGDLLGIAIRNKIPLVYDNLHNELNPFDESKDDKYFIKLANKTWTIYDGVQKIHYSQSSNNKKIGSHSETINLEIFSDFLKGLPNVDIMLEVKDKNISAIKVNNLINPKKSIKDLEEDWARYKYNILEHSPAIYEEIRKLLKDKKSYPVIEFYSLVDKSLSIEASEGNIINALSHVWGYFKNQASEGEKKKYESYIKYFKKGDYSIGAVKKLLLEMAVKYENKYLLESYYFYF